MIIAIIDGIIMHIITLVTDWFAFIWFYFFGSSLVSSSRLSQNKGTSMWGNLCLSEDVLKCYMATAKAVKQAAFCKLLDIWDLYGLGSLQ